MIIVSAGLKPGQRKVLFTCFKRNLVKELKVAQLAGSVAELSSYHHGEVLTSAARNIWLLYLFLLCSNL
jgi:DNA gyrase/topoisomerase IV subunit A